MSNGNAAQRRKEKRKNETSVPSHEPCGIENNADEGKRENLGQKEQENAPMLEKLRFPSAAVWTVIFTAMLTGFTYLEYRVSRETSEIQKSSERAYLTFVGPQLGARIVGGAVADPNATWTGQEVSLNWVNNGETPARDAVVQTKFDAFFPDIPKEYDFPLSNDKTHVVVGPKTTYGTNIQIPLDILMDNWQAKKRIFVWGDILYKDVFSESKDRLTEFCVELTHLTLGPMNNTATNPGSNQAPATGDKPAIPQDAQNAPVTANPTSKIGLFNFQWQQCRAHNCYDEDCSDYDARSKDMRN